MHDTALTYAIACAQPRSPFNYSRTRHPKQWEPNTFDDPTIRSAAEEEYNANRNEWRYAR